MNSKTEMVNNMREAVHEIRQLRRQNELLSAQLYVFDSMMCLLHSAPATRTQGASPDVAYALEGHIQRLNQEQEAEDSAAQADMRDRRAVKAMPAETNLGHQ